MVKAIIVRVDCHEGPPVPIPNTEVKLMYADNTRRVTAREDRKREHKPPTKVGGFFLLKHASGMFLRKDDSCPNRETLPKIRSPQRLDVDYVVDRSEEEAQ